MADIKERIIIESVDNTTRGMRSAQNKLNAFDRTLKRVQTTMLGFVGINIATHMVQGLTRMSDSAVELDAKLRLMTDSTEDFNYAQQELVEISLESGSSLEANTILFTRMNKAIKSMGGNTQTTLDTTRALSQGLRISGASTQESASVIRQWSQAMASGVLRGEEFNAVSENGARIIQAISESLGVSIGELRAMSKEGVLTAQVVTDALLKQSKTIAEENAKLPLTIGRAIENVNTQWTLLLQSMAEGNEGVADVINTLALNFGSIAKAMSDVVDVAIYYVGLKLTGYFIQQSIALKKYITDQIASSQATKAEILAKQDLMAVEAQVSARRRVFAIQQAGIEVARAERTVASAKLELQQLTLAERKLFNEVKLQSAVVASTRSEEARSIALAKSNALNGQLLAIRANRIRSARILTAVEADLTATLNVQTGAILANAKAQKVKDRTAILSLATLSKGFKGLGKLVSKFTSALLGLPGIVAFIAYEIVTYFVPVEVLLAKLTQYWERLTLTAQYFWDNVKAGGATEEALFEYEQGLAKIDEQYNKTLDSIIEGEQKQRSSLSQTNELRVKGTIDSLTKMSEAEDKYQKTIDANIARSGELRKLKIANRLTDKINYQVQSDAIDKQIAEEQAQSRIDRFNKELEDYSTFYDTKVESLIEANDRIATATEESAELIQARELGLTLRIEELQQEHHNKVLSAQKANDDEIVRLSGEKATKLKEISQKSLDVLIEHSNKLLDDQKKAFDENEALHKDYKNFLKEINGDQRADYQKLSDAQQVQRDIEKKLREASQAEAEGNHEKAQKLGKEAYEQAKELAGSYQDISENADKGSRSQVVANNSVKIALDLVKDSVNQLDSSYATLNENRQTEIDQTKNNIEQYTNLIAELDKLLDESRSVVVDINDDEVLGQIDAIDAKIKSLSQDVVVNVKTVKTGEGDVPVRRNSGGFIPRSNKVPGTGSGDKVKALLEPGEFIIRKSAVQKFGENAMYALNRGEEPIRRRSGGIIPGIQKFATGGGVSGYSVDKLIDFAGNKYTKLLDEYIRKAQSPGTGTDAYFASLAHSGVVSIIKNVIPTLSKLRGKDPEKVNRVLKLNEDLLSSAISSATLDRGAGQLSKSLRNSANRARLMALRDAWIQRLNVGGIVQRFNSGGNVLGSGLGDSVKALLTPGEFVMKKGAVQSFGSDFMNSINQGILPQRFANGGLVGAGIDGADTININFNVNGSEATGTFTKNDATMNLIDQLKSAEASS